MLSYLLAALESEEDKRRFTELYEENHVRAEQTALRILITASAILQITMP